MREADKAECLAFGRTPKDGLRMSLRTSLHALTALDPEGKPLAMFGVTPLNMTHGKGSPWFLGTDGVMDYAFDLMRRGPKIIAWFHETFPIMENLVSKDNRKAISLLKHWGAEFSEGEMIGGVEFLRFRFVAIQGDSASE
jgi:hypothetical protein